MPENGQEKTPLIPKMAQFLKSGKNNHFAKATAKQNGRKWSTLGLSFKVPKTYRDYPLTSLESQPSEDARLVRRQHFRAVRKYSAGRENLE